MTEWCPEKDASVRRLSSCRPEPWQQSQGVLFYKLFFLLLYVCECLSVSVCTTCMLVSLGDQKREGVGSSETGAVGGSGIPAYLLSKSSHCSPCPELFAKENSLLSCEEITDRKCWSTCV